MIIITEGSVKPGSGVSLVQWNCSRLCPRCEKSDGAKTATAPSGGCSASPHSEGVDNKPVCGQTAPPGGGAAQLPPRLTHTHTPLVPEVLVLVYGSGSVSGNGSDSALWV